MFNFEIVYNNKKFLYSDSDLDITTIYSNRHGIKIIFKKIIFAKEVGILNSIKINNYYYDKLPIFFKKEGKNMIIVIMKSEFKK